MGHDDHGVAVVVMACVRDNHHFGEAARDAHWHCSRLEKEDGFRHGLVDHGLRALEFLGVVVAVVRGEGHDVHDVRSSTLKYFLYDLSVTTKKIDDAQGC